MMSATEEGTRNAMLLHGARYAVGPRTSRRGSIQIVDKRIRKISNQSINVASDILGGAVIDLDGYFLLPGLINSHDHLEFALHPKLADPPYRNYIEWGIDIHKQFPDIIEKHRAVPKNLRLWWGGIRNLLCGATTVAHHNPLWPDLQRDDFPVRVVQEYGWGHSLAFGGDLRAARRVTPRERAFIVHACEGVDEEAQNELWELDRLGLLDANTVLVHGLAVDARGVALMRERGTGLIVCPSSNKFLFGKLPDLALLGKLDNVSLGCDSPMTSDGDLLDETRFAIRLCGLSGDAAYHMVTEAPAAILRLTEAQGTLKESGAGDLIAIRDTGLDAAERLHALSITDVELVVVRGSIQLASEALMEGLPSTIVDGLEALCIDGAVRWIRAPVRELLRNTEAILGKGMVRLGGRRICIST